MRLSAALLLLSLPAVAASVGGGAGGDEAIDHRHPFIRRFHLFASARGPYDGGRAPVIDRARLETLQAFVASQETLSTAGFLRAYGAAEPALRRPLAEIYLSLVGEKAAEPAGRPEADRALGALAEGLGREFEGFLARADSRGRLGPDRELPERFPGALRSVLDGIEADGFAENFNGGFLVRRFMSSAQVLEHPRFYEEAARRNLSLRRTLAQRRVELVSAAGSRSLSEERRRAEIAQLTAMFREGGPELDWSRMMLIGAAATSGGELLAETELIEASLDLRGDFSLVPPLPFTAVLFQDAGEEKRRLLSRYFGLLVERDAAAFLGALAEHEAFLRRDPRRVKFRELALFLDPFHAAATARVGRPAYRLSDLTR